jgi:hypothetical protein
LQRAKNLQGGQQWRHNGDDIRAKAIQFLGCRDEASYKVGTENGPNNRAEYFE